MDEKRKLAAEITRDIIVTLINNKSINSIERKVSCEGKEVAVFDNTLEISRHWNEIFKTVYSSLGGKE